MFATKQLPVACVAFSTALRSSILRWKSKLTLKLTAGPLKAPVLLEGPL